MSDKTTNPVITSVSDNQVAAAVVIGSPPTEKTGSGYCFYLEKLIKVKDKETKEVIETKTIYEYITYQISDKPVLTAINKEQANNWSKVVGKACEVVTSKS